MNLLFVDPDGAYVYSIAAELSHRRHSVLVATTAKDALEHLANLAVDAIFCPLELPDSSGIALLERSRVAAPEAFRVAILCSDGKEAVVAAVNEGRAHYVVDNARFAEQLEALFVAIEVHRAGYLARQHSLESAQEWARCLEARVAEVNETSEQALEDMLVALVTALDMREYESANHSRRVALYCLFFASRLGVESDNYENIYHGALLHDVGKIGIRDSVLLKPGRLTDEERRHMETHVQIGVQLLWEVVTLRPALDVPQYHHEHYDGLGYVAGLSSQDIPLSARMFAVVDVYDALRSERPYKGALTHEATLDIIRKEAGTHFDPGLVGAFCEISSEQWRAVADTSRRVRSFAEAMVACDRARLEPSEASV